MRISGNIYDNIREAFYFQVETLKKAIVPSLAIASVGTALIVSYGAKQGAFDNPRNQKAFIENVTLNLEAVLDSVNPFN